MADHPKYKDGVCDYPKCHGQETIEWLGKSLCIKHLSWVDDPELYSKLVKKLKLPVEVHSDSEGDGSCRSQT